MSFTQRSYQKELLDGDLIPFEDIKRNMEELDKINHYLGGHSITLKGLQAIIRHIPSNQEVHIVEIGSGGGDNLQVIKQWADKHNRKVLLTGIDINPECVVYAQGLLKNEGIRFIHSDYKEVTFDNKPHVIYSSLFCHHFRDDELVQMLQWMQQQAQLGFFINDLHRHPMAYYSIRIITQLFSRSYLVKNDAPLSVQRGFSRAEWHELFAQARIKPFRCNWQWAFRWLVLYLHPNEHNRSSI
jgi:2-polyprenyl-3-methyl-5-hydroxy-6-metoxy-1,4-benzoquinol methylase